MATTEGKTMGIEAPACRSGWLRWALLLLPATLWAVAASGQPLQNGASRLSLAVDDHRPLAALAGELESRYAITLTYEEGPWSASRDVEDVTQAVIKSSGPGRALPTLAILVPRKAAVSFELPFDSAKAAPADYTDLVSALLAQYDAAGAPGKFRFEGGERIYHLIPARLEGKDGKWVDVAPVLSTPIHLEDAERSVDDTLDEVVAQLNRSSPVPVGWGFVPLNLFNRTKVRLSADGLPAREVMRRILQLLPRRATWRLNYDPTTQRYYLSFLLLPGGR